jgi:UDP-3-O-[3-hydroxymyristoyl] glucosamine N-acyltransferase
MVNPFFKNNGPFKLMQILEDLNIKLDEKKEASIITDIKDLQNSKTNEITFFHSKKYKSAANNTKASFCITTKNLIDELPKSCLPIIVNNVLVSTSIITAKFYQDSTNDNFDTSVKEINNTKFIDKVKFGKNVLIGQNVSIGSNCFIGHNTIIEKNVTI